MHTNSEPTTLIFDDQGTTWNASSLSIRQKFGLFEDTPILSGLMVRNMGFASVQLNAKSTVISLQPAIVSQVAIACLLYWLSDHRPTGLVLKISSSDGQFELVRSMRGLVRRLAVLMAQNDPNGDNFSKNAIAPDQLRGSSPFSNLLQLWADNNDESFLRRSREILDRKLGSRFLLLRPAVDTSEVEILSRGKGYLSIPGSDWFASAEGNFVGQAPDYTYGQWVSSAYQSVFQSQQPKIDQIDANIFWPKEGRVKRRYTRIILPCALPDGKKGLLSATCTSGDFGLHVKAA